MRCYLLMVQVNLLTVFQLELDVGEGKGFLSWQPTYTLIWSLTVLLALSEYVDNYRA